MVNLTDFNVIFIITFILTVNSDKLNRSLLPQQVASSAPLRLKIHLPMSIHKCNKSHLTNNWIVPSYNKRNTNKNRTKLWKRRKRFSKKYTIRREESGYINMTSSFTNEYFKSKSFLLKKYSNEVNFIEIKFHLVDVDVNAETDYKILLKKFQNTWPVERWKKYGLFSDDFLHLINAHWMHFAPPSREVHLALGGLYTILMVVGCSGNAMVIFMYVRCRSLRTPGNILVVNLALSDFLMIAKTPMFVFNSFNLGPALGKSACVAYGFIGGLSGTTSISILAAIAMDRYWAVVRPLEPLRALTAIRARCLAVAAWVYAAIFSAIPALDIGYGRYVPEGYLTSCSFDYLTDELPPRYFIFVFFCAAWLVPFCTISFCYTKIIRVVIYTRNVAIRSQEQRLSSRHIKEDVKRKAEIKLAVLVIAIIALFFLAWTPYAVVALLGISGKKELITPIVSMVPALFCKSAACIDPFIYIITHPNFRKEFKFFITRRKSKRFDTFGGTIKTIGMTEGSKKRLSKDISVTDVEVVELKNIPYSDVNSKTEDRHDNVQTVSEIVQRGSSKQSVIMKSFDDDVVPPPSWFVKPKFSKRNSIKK